MNLFSENSQKGINPKKSKFKTLPPFDSEQQEMNEISNQFYDVKIFSNFETKNDHFSKTQEKPIEISMEIEPEMHELPIKSIETPIETPQTNEQDVFKQQEEKLFNRNDLKVLTKNLNNRFQDNMEINSDASIPKKKTKDCDVMVHEFRHLIFSPQCSESVFKRHLTIIYRGLMYAKKCLKGPSENYLKSKQIDLISRLPLQSSLFLNYYS